MLRIFVQHFSRRAHKPTASYFFSHAHNVNCCFSTSCAALVKPACATPPDYGPSEMGRSTLNNGIKLVSARPFGAEMAACTILFQGGSRFEYDDQLGVTHFLRRCSSASGCAYSTFSKTRVLQQLGSYITVNADRQSIAYTLRCPAPAFHDVKYYLMDIAARSFINTQGP